MSIRRAGRVLIAALALCLVAPAPPGAASHLAWQAEVQRPVAAPAATALTSDGAAHLWAIEHGLLVYVWQSADGWSTEVVDGAGGPGGRVQAELGSPVAQVHRGQLHVYYVDVQHGDLRHAWRDGAGWRFAVLDGQQVGGGGEGSATAAVGPDVAAIVHAGRPRVFYRTTDASGVTALRRARWTGQRWTYRTLAVEDEPAHGLAAVSAGRPHVWTAVEGGLRHLWWDGTSWRSEVITVATPVPGQVDRSRPVAAVDADGRPHVFFQGGSASHTQVQAVRWDGATWRSEGLGTGETHCPCVALRGGDGLQVWFNGHHMVNSGEIEMRHARLVDGGWQVEDFRTGGEPWGLPRAAAAASDRLHVWYASDIWPRLWHAWAPLGG